MARGLEGHAEGIVQVREASSQKGPSCVARLGPSRSRRRKVLRGKRFEVLQLPDSNETDRGSASDLLTKGNKSHSGGHDEVVEVDLVDRVGRPMTVGVAEACDKPFGYAGSVSFPSPALNSPSPG